MAQFRKAITAALAAGASALAGILTGGPVVSGDYPKDAGIIVGAMVAAGLAVYFVVNSPAPPVAIK